MPDKVGLLRRIQYLAEYALVRGLAGLIGLLPEGAAVLLGQSLGRLYWALAFFRRRIARENIEKAMPGELSAAEVRRLIREVFVHIGLTAVEALWARKHVNRQNIMKRFPVEGTEPVEENIAAGRGMVGFTPHLGNWELFGSCLAVWLGKVTALARPVNNPLVERYTTQLRERMGVQIVSTRTGVRPMIKAIRGGRLMGLLIDQHVNRAFVPATFFGRPAATTAVVASLALRLDAPVFMAYSLRDGHSFRHHGYVEGPLDLVRTGDTEADVLANTQRFNDKLEEVVRRNPEQWLWTHRRWKLADRLERKESETHVG